MSSLISHRGDYKNLLSFRKAQLIFDLTFYFCKTFLEAKDRTVDQMIQAARSGKQNIAEGSFAGATTKTTEIKLTNVAKASLQELLLDYEDFLRVRNLRQWQVDSPEVIFIRQKCKDPAVANEWFLNIAKTRPAETVANMAIVFIHQADFLLRKQLQTLSNDFINDGGFKEKMKQFRINQRKQSHNSHKSHNSHNNLQETDSMKTEFEELLTPEALEELRSVAFKVWPQTFKSILSSEQIEYMMEMMYAAKVLADELDKGYHFEILRIDNSSAGYISYSRCDDSPDTAKLHKVYLMHDFHGMGLGQKMLDHAQAQCRKLGFKNIMLCVNKNNARAIKAYQRNGFTIDSAICKPIGNGFVMDDYIMKKLL